MARQRQTEDGPRVTWSGVFHGRLACGCICSLTKTEIDRGDAPCIGKHLHAKKERMQLIVATGDEYTRPRRCNQPQPQPQEDPMPPVWSQTPVRVTTHITPAGKPDTPVIVLPDGEGQARLAI